MTKPWWAGQNTSGYMVWWRHVGWGNPLLFIHLGWSGKAAMFPLYTTELRDYSPLGGRGGAQSQWQQWLGGYTPLEATIPPAAIFQRLFCNRCPQSHWPQWFEAILSLGAAIPLTPMIWAALSIPFFPHCVNFCRCVYLKHCNSYFTPF